MSRRTLLLGLTALLLLTLNACCAHLMPSWLRGPPTPPPPAPAPGEPMILDRVWTAEGFWKGVDVDPSTGDIYAAISTYAPPDDMSAADWRVDTETAGCLIDQRRIPRERFTSIWRVDRQGQRSCAAALRGFESGTGNLRIARLTSGEAPSFVLFDQFNDKAVRAFDASGKQLWRFAPPYPYSVHDAAIADLDQDGRDEVIISAPYVMALNADGSSRWQSNSGYWSVTTARTGDTGETQVISGGWSIEFLNPTGQARRPTKKVESGWSVRAAYRGPGEEPIIVCQDDYVKLQGLDLAGNVLWKTSDKYHCYTVDAAASPDEPWIAYALKDSTIIVYDVRNGHHLASVRVAGSCPTLAWAAKRGDDPPLLLVASGFGLDAFVMRPAPSPPKTD